MGVYVFDTNIIVHLAWQSYPADRFPTLHAWVDSMVAADRVIAPTFVKKECEKYQNNALEWIKAREAKIVQPHDAQVQLNAQALIRHYEPPPGVQASEPLEKFLFGADPFVIALAYVRGATIVTNEKPGGSPTKPKIPTVAAGWNVPCVDFFGLMGLEKVTF